LGDLLQGKRTLFLFLCLCVSFLFIAVFIFVFVSIFVFCVRQAGEEQRKSVTREAEGNSVSKGKIVRHIWFFLRQNEEAKKNHRYVHV